MSGETQILFGFTNVIFVFYPRKNVSIVTEHAPEESERADSKLRMSKLVVNTFNGPNWTKRTQKAASEMLGDGRPPGSVHFGNQGGHHPQHLWVVCEQFQGL